MFFDLMFSICSAYAESAATAISATEGVEMSHAIALVQILRPVVIIVLLLGFMVFVGYKAMKSQNVLKIISSVLSILCLLVLIAGALGILFLNENQIAAEDFDRAIKIGDAYGTNEFIASLLSKSDQTQFFFMRYRNLFFWIGGVLFAISLLLFICSRFIEQNRSNHRVSGNRSQVPQTTINKIFIRPDKCCICGGSLLDGYAILFTTTAGSEARIDKNCCDQIAILAQGGSRQEITNALVFIQSKIPITDPSVATYLNNYISNGQRLLSQQHQL